jgi:hypothetical protein
VTVNDALERIHHMSELTPGAARRAEEAHAHAGGNGLDVTRALVSAGSQCQLPISGRGRRASRSNNRGAAVSSRRGLRQRIPNASYRKHATSK